MSGMLTTLAGSCIGHTTILVGTGAGDFRFAIKYTVVMIMVLVALGSILYIHKKKLHAAVQDEEKDSLTGYSPSEYLALGVDDGIRNLTGAMASVLVNIWFKKLPWTHGLSFFIETLVVGVLALILGETIQLWMTKGSMGRYIMKMLNGLLVGIVSWWLGFSLSNETQNIFGAPDGPSKDVNYKMFIVALFCACINMELFNIISAKLCKNKEGHPYGFIIFSAIKGTPMFSAGLVLNNVVQYRYGPNDYLSGTLIWVVIAAVFIITFDQIAQMPALTEAKILYYGPKVAHQFGRATVSLLGQIFAFVCGSMASSALMECLAPMSDALWIAYFAFFQLLGCTVEFARHQWLPGTKSAGAREWLLTKPAGTREYQLLKE